MAHGRGGAGRGFGREGAGSGANLSNILPPVMRPIAPDLFLDFTKDLARTTVLTTAASLITTSRASAGYANDASGNWINFGSNVPRITSLGLLVEESRTNSIRNNSMQGAIVQADSVELLTNGNFAAGGAGWTTHINGGSVTFSTGSVVIVGNNSDYTNYISQQITGLTVGRSYVVSITETAGFFGLTVGTTSGAADVLSLSGIIGNGQANNFPDRYAFTATQSSLWVNLGSQGTGTLTSISVQDGERCQNGGFTANPINAAQGTVQNGWEWARSAGAGTVTWNGSNAVTLASDAGNTVSISAPIPTVAGFTYTFSGTVAGVAGTTFVCAGTTLGGSELLANQTLSNGAFTFQFTATGTTSYINLKSFNTSGAGTYSNVAVKSAGALPTNWLDTTSAANEIRRNVVGLGTENGVDYIDIRWSGTVTTNRTIPMYVDATNQIAATYGQTWTMSAFLKLVAGSLSGFGFGYLGFDWYSGGNSYLNTISQSILGMGGGLSRWSANGTPNNSAVGFVAPVFNFGTPASGPIDFTIRLGWPQIENNTLINATVATAVKAANGTGGVNGSAVYKLSAAGVTQATLNCTWAAGVLTVNSIANAGSYASGTFPASPAALTYVSGTATGWTGATVNLTPTDNSALAAASSPIRTTGAAATRAADFVTLTSPPSNGAAYTVFGKGTSQIPAGSGYNNATAVIAWDDGVGNNATTIFRNIVSNSGIPQYFVVVGGTAVNGGEGIGVTPWAGGVSGKLAMAYSAGSQNGAFNGAGGGVNSTTIPGAGVLTRVVIGCNQNGDFWNGFLSQIALWRSTALSSGNLQSITT